MTDDCDTETTQCALHEPSEREQAQTVHVVVANYADDPHPHVEGVHSHIEAAEQHIIELSDQSQPPYPIAWDREEVEVDDV